MDNKLYIKRLETQIKILEGNNAKLQASLNGSST